jgi:hypothetical protein
MNCTREACRKWLWRHWLRRLALILAIVRAAPAGANAPPQEPAEVDLPSFGVRAPIPSGWRRQREDDAALAVRWIKLDEPAAKLEGMISLQLTPRRAAPNVRALVEAAAKRNGGRVVERAVRLGGLDAVEMISDAAPAQPGSAIVLLRAAEHAGNYYMLYQTVPAATSRAAFDEIAQGIHFSAPKPPSESLAPRADPVPLEGARLVLALPDPYRRASPNKQNPPEFRVLNFATGKSEVELSISPVQQAIADASATAESTGQMLAAKFGWEQPPKWNIIRKQFTVAYTDLIPAGADASGKRVAPMQLMLVVNDGKGDMMSFIYPGPEAATARYATQLVDIANSLRHAPEYFEARDATRKKLGEGNAGPATRPRAPA